ncbi:MAG TPA: hypothetical protein DD670_18820 [Planctomycetaceae bacterium]|nr:hypothetical protein [Planctomycetaceae bacterium]
MYLDARKSLEWPKAEPNRIINQTSDLTEGFKPPAGKGLFPLVPLSPLETAWVEMNAETIRKAIEASRRTAMAFDRPGFRSGKLAMESDVARLAELLVRSARKHAIEGDLDVALEHYLTALRMTSHIQKFASSGWPGQVPNRLRDGLLSWAAHPDQTAERLKRALDEVKRIPADYSSYERFVKWRWEYDLSDLGGRSPHRQNWDEAMRLLALRWLPWENVRARRILDYLARGTIDELRRVEVGLKSNEPVESAPVSPDAARLCNTTCLRGLLDVNTIGWLTENRIDEEMHRRALVLQLALAAWRREHGSLPKTLDELVGTYLDAVPVDPYTGKPFAYYPEGRQDAGLGVPMGMEAYDLGPGGTGGIEVPEVIWEGPMGPFDASFFAREKAQWGAPYFRSPASTFYIP